MSPNLQVLDAASAAIAPPTALDPMARVGGANTVQTLRSLRDDDGSEAFEIENDFSFDLSGPHQIAVPKRQQIPQDPANLERRISHLFTRASKDFQLLQAGDKVMVCMSGGKDSYGLLHFMQRAQKHSPIKFDVIAVHLDQGHPGFPLHTLEDYLRNSGSPYEIVHSHTYAIVMEKLEPGKTTCSLCSRLRRGILYDTAKRLGCNKIALGHHRDDMAATLLLNLFFCGQLKAMPAKLRADDGINTVIRPLAYVPEAMLVKWAQLQKYPLIPCNLCSRQPDLKRAQMNTLLADIDRRYPSALPSALHAVQNVKPRFLLDRNLYDFEATAGAADRDDDAFG
ncbi:MAG: tRNA 2-thiocytidine(32) synthetase TtcA [Myxococcales bacterium]|nr:tRNA 2-thiocytidine(32) synthetase TtcA [Myxococcales bacterium]